MLKTTTFSKDFNELEWQQQQCS